MARVLVIGASRGIGLQTVKAALKASHDVRALARSASRIPVTDPHLEKVAGDALDPETMDQALEGIDVVIQALGVDHGPDMVLRPVSVFSKATGVLVPAMQRAGVKRLICVTGFGAGDSRNRGGPLHTLGFHLFLGRAYDDKDRQERIIRESDLDWVIARPGILTTGPATGRYRVLVEPRDWRLGFISRRDVADFLVKQIDCDDYLGKTPALIG